MKAIAVSLLLTGIALAANPKDEQVVRTAYAKLAYAVQSKIVYQEAQRNRDLKTAELTQKLRDNELRFDIEDMSSGMLADVDSKPWSDYVTPPNGQDVLGISFDTETLDENGKRYTSYFAIAHWAKDSDAQEWNSTVKEVTDKERSVFFRYVTATVTVHFQERSRTYHTMWLFGTDVRPIDLVTGNGILDEFAKHGAYPSVLTDSSFRSRSVVNDWLNSTQRSDSSCRAGKQDVCCDSAMRCGVNVEDLRSTEPAPNTKPVSCKPRGGERMHLTA